MYNKTICKIKRKVVLPVVLLISLIFIPYRSFAAEATVSPNIKQPAYGNSPNFLEPFQRKIVNKDTQVNDKKQFNITGGSYSFANGAAAKLGLNALKQKPATDISGRLQGRLLDLIVQGNGLSNANSTPNFLTSIEISYPVGRRLTLDGGYAVIKRDTRTQGLGGGSEERRIPSLGASYTVNTNTSISVNYHRINVRDPHAKKSREEHEASAELRINF